jgi:hypothetical protein
MDEPPTATVQHLGTHVKNLMQNLKSLAKVRIIVRRCLGFTRALNSSFYLAAKPSVFTVDVVLVGHITISEGVKEEDYAKKYSQYGLTLIMAYGNMGSCPASDEVERGNAKGKKLSLPERPF